MSKIQVYGWEVSPFTVKVLSYLKYKQLDPRLIIPNAWQLNFKIKKDVGQIIMPVVYDDDHVLQDSSAIIDFYELSYRSRSIIPEQPLHKITAYLLELLGDEWLPLAALHYRWNYPENRPFIYGEFGRSALPRFPKFLQKQIGKKLGGKMSAYLPVLGINQSMHQPLESNTHAILNALNTHLSEYEFLFGTRPSLADFSLYGPIYAHLHRDPFPDKLLTPYPNIIRWINTLNGPLNHHKGQWIESPSLPMSMLPLLQMWKAVHFPLIESCIETFDNWCLHNPDKTTLPRSFGSTSLRINGNQSNRLNLSYVIWMWQRIQRVYEQFTDSEKRSVDVLLNQLGILQLIQTPLSKPVQLKNCRLLVEAC